MKSQVQIKQLQRIRNYDKIVGYRRIEEGNHFYSKDLFWWNGAPITGIQTDQCCGLKDLSDRPIFEQDIIEVESKGLFKKKRHFLVYQAEGSWFGKNWKTGQSEPLELLFLKHSVKFVSYAFLNS